ncbi:hypothetical protein, partial [Parasutterella excrementihominis]|uniref:hypothetical protein n=1 Tax=Parasutterella excrementihominis TaxID=487175 RepID=UPI0035661144
KSANVGALIFIVTLFGSVLIIAYHPLFVQRFLTCKEVIWPLGSGMFEKVVREHVHTLITAD